MRKEDNGMWGSDHGIILYIVSCWSGKEELDDQDGRSERLEERYEGQVPVIVDPFEPRLPVERSLVVWEGDEG